MRIKRHHEFSYKQASKQEYCEAEVTIIRGIDTLSLALPYQPSPPLARSLFLSHLVSLSGILDVVLRFLEQSFRLLQLCLGYLFLFIDLIDQRLQEEEEEQEEEEQEEERGKSKRGRTKGIVKEVPPGIGKTK